MHLTILRGISGSGKTTWAQQHAKDAVVVSTDDFFTEDGVYQFDASKLQENHVRCFRLFLDALTQGKPRIVVDNTNINAWEYSPYVLAGEAFGYKVELLTLMCPVDISLARKKLLAKYDLERTHKRLVEETTHMPGRFQRIHRVVDTSKSL